MFSIFFKQANKPWNCTSPGTDPKALMKTVEVMRSQGTMAFIVNIEMLVSMTELGVLMAVENQLAQGQ